jgi:predicted membrane metal-binding protein
MATHEPVISHRKVRTASDRSFGLVFGAVFALISLWPVLDGQKARLWALPVAGAFVLVAFTVPALLAPLNRLWQRFGLALHQVTTPLLMALIFYGAVVPTALLARALSKDFLHLKKDPSAASYWVRRQPPGPEHGSMSRQF